MQEQMMDTDDRALAELGAERYETTMMALYQAAMRGLDDDLVRHLCAECGVTYADLERYVPPYLRPTRKTEGTVNTIPF